MFSLQKAGTQSAEGIYMHFSVLLMDQTIRDAKYSITHADTLEDDSFCPLESEEEKNKPKKEVVLDVAQLFGRSVSINHG